MKSRTRRFLPVLLISLQTILLCRWCLPFQSRNSSSRRRKPSKYVSAQANVEDSQSFTTCILRVSYDGTRFTGWSASNDGAAGGDGKRLEAPKPSKRSRRRNKIESPDVPKGYVRSVEGVLRANLCKIYGNVDPRRVVVEGCSRTDRGVHAQGLIAQIYCLKAGVLEQLDNEKEESMETILTSIPGKRLPHPRSPNDHSYFEPLPMNGNLSRLAFALNRMRPSDVQVTGIALVPSVRSPSRLPFHPTLSSLSKRYEYTISTGAFQDPMMDRFAWYIGNSLDIANIQLACKVLVGSHSFAAFQGVPRGPEDRKKHRMDRQNLDASKCTLIRVDIKEFSAPSGVYFNGVSPPIQHYKVTVEGDRFLYKMVRFLVGALVAVGSGKLRCEDLERALQSGTWEVPGQEFPRRIEFECAPAHGLVLASVDFGNLEFNWQPLHY